MSISVSVWSKTWGKGEQVSALSSAGSALLNLVCVNITKSLFNESIKEASDTPDSSLPRLIVIIMR